VKGDLAVEHAHTVRTEDSILEDSFASDESSTAELEEGQGIYVYKYAYVCIYVCIYMYICIYKYLGMYMFICTERDLYQPLSTFVSEGEEGQGVVSHFFILHSMFVLYLCFFLLSPHVTYGGWFLALVV
jgi:hypothetical protein